MSILASDESCFCCVWYLKSIILFDRNKLSIQLENLSEAWHHESEKISKLTRSWYPYLESSGPMIQKSYSRIGIAVPSRTKHAARHRCWMNIGGCVICHIELCFRLRHTSSRKFYSTLMKDLIDDYNAMIARRPGYGSWIPSWILRVWTVNESWRFRSISFSVSKSNVVSGVSGRNIGINSSKLQSGIILYKRIHNFGLKRRSLPRDRCAVYKHIRVGSTCTNAHLTH